MRPSRKLLKILVAWMGLALLVFALRLIDIGSPVDADVLASDHWISSSVVWWGATVALVLIALFDALRHRKLWRLDVERELPHSLALGVYAQVKLVIFNNYDFPVTMDVTDMYPQCVDVKDLPISVTVDARSKKALLYPVLPVSRGEARFAETCLRVNTRWGLWQKEARFAKLETVKVFPNFTPIAHSSGIGLEHQIAQLGVHLQQRRGEGSDFHQLREFREGDSLRQIDWKATSRHRKPISREYQDERDQDIVFLLDCGRRLRAKDDHFSHFDHALNALLLTSYVALRQGDAVGLMSFAGDERWMSPIKGPARINTILNQLYDLHSSTETSDYLQAAEQFLAHSSKRALVIVITNVREEDVNDLSVAVGLLAKKHIVMVASLRDKFLDAHIQKPVLNMGDALSYCGTMDYIQRRRRVLAQLQSMGTIITDSLPHHLHVDLVNEYFKLKRSGRL